MSLMTISLLPSIKRSKTLNLKFTAMPMKMNRLILVDVNRHSVKPVKFLQTIKFHHRGLITLRQRLTDLVKSGATRKDLDTKLKTDDLNWPFPPERLDELWNEFGPSQ